MNSQDLSEIRDELKGLVMEAVADALRDADAPLTAEDLMARGYSQKEAYALLHRHGVRLPGAKRIRISKKVLERIEQGEA